MDKTIYEILQILNVSVFDKTPLNELLTDTQWHKHTDSGHNQLKLFDL